VIKIFGVIDWIKVIIPSDEYRESDKDGKDRDEEAATGMYDNCSSRISKGA